MKSCLFHFASLLFSENHMLRESLIVFFTGAEKPAQSFAVNFYSERREGSFTFYQQDALFSSYIAQLQSSV